MNIGDLIGQLLGRQMQVVQGADGTTYGPAQSRISRTPIEFSENMPSARTQGEFIPAENRIRMNPNSKGFPINQVLRHEQIHAVLNGLPNAGVPQAEAAPGFSDIAQRVQGAATGNMGDEVPAYMGQSQTPGFYGISPEQRNAYIQGLQSQLVKLDPKIAERFAKLTKGN
jgi:hypothetical protein